MTLRRATTRLSLCLVLASSLMGGCASIQDCKYETGQRFRGVMEYYKCADRGHTDFPADYRHGWLDGFNEVITGGPDCPPAIAPQRYWKPRQILKNCDQRRAAYYAGWRAGAKRAGCLPDTHFLKVYETADCPFPKCDCVESDCDCGMSQPADVIMDSMLFDDHGLSVGGSSVIENFDAALQISP